MKKKSSLYRKNGEIVTLLTIAAMVVVGLSVFVSSLITNQNKNTTSTRATGGVNCADIPDIPSPDTAPNPHATISTAGYYWEADCNNTKDFLQFNIRSQRSYCVANTECAKNETQGEVNAASSNFCYTHFADGDPVTFQDNRCMMVKYGRLPGAPVNTPTPTQPAATQTPTPISNCLDANNSRRNPGESYCKNSNYYYCQPNAQERIQQNCVNQNAHCGLNTQGNVTCLPNSGGQPPPPQQPPQQPPAGSCVYGNSSLNNNTSICENNGNVTKCNNSVLSYNKACPAGQTCPVGGISCQTSSNPPPANPLCPGANRSGYMTLDDGKCYYCTGSGGQGAGPYSPLICSTAAPRCGSTLGCVQLSDGNYWTCGTPNQQATTQCTPPPVKTEPNTPTPPLSCDSDKERKDCNQAYNNTCVKDSNGCWVVPTPTPVPNKKITVRVTAQMKNCLEYGLDELSDEITRVGYIAQIYDAKHNELKLLDSLDQKSVSIYGKSNFSQLYGFEYTYNIKTLQDASFDKILFTPFLDVAHYDVKYYEQRQNHAPISTDTIESGRAVVKLDHLTGYYTFPSQYYKNPINIQVTYDCGSHK